MNLIVRPDFALEAAHAGPVAGVDEVGRGPMAGPVVAAAVIFLDPLRIPNGIADSKVLAKAERERLDAEIRAVAMVGVGAASVDEIDRINILQATFKAMQRAVARLPTQPAMVLVDGDRTPRFDCCAMPVVRGDARSLSIAAASIVAKVTRDHLMERLASRYPDYGWESNAGYCTAFHRGAVDRHGLTRHHRRSFAPVRAAHALELESRLRFLL
ncbi:MAG: ribonuclease HII [Alphaproteobacteria bacterium]|nr:ribonuclease HII [Alphaproteobacteria bacterium]